MIRRTGRGKFPLALMTRVVLPDTSCLSFQKIDFFSVDRVKTEVTLFIILAAASFAHASYQG